MILAYFLNLKKEGYKTKKSMLMLLSYSNLPDPNNTNNTKILFHY